MEIKNENNLIQEAFEVEAEEIGFCLDQKWGDYENPYENSDTALAFNLFKKGWQAKSQALPEWIGVEDRHPKYGEPILIVINGVVQNITYMRDGSDNSADWCEPYHFEHDDCMKIWWSEVTHWMPLPKVIQAQEQSHEE